VTERLDDDGRCVVSDLFPDQCACPDHRGGSLPDDADPHGQGLASARRDHDDQTRDQWGSAMFLASFGGKCGWCETPFKAGAGVRYDQDDRLVGPCCAENDVPIDGLGLSDV
jgi:hypothetical protein